MAPYSRAAHKNMIHEHEQAVSTSALTWRKRLAESPISNKLFPIEYKDPFNTMSQVSKHLEFGGSVVMVTTHPSIEDIGREGKLFFIWEELRARRIGSPAAVHQKIFVELATALFDIEKVYVPTQRTRKRRTVSDGEEMAALIRYKKFIINLLQNNSVLAVEPQADQASSLKRPEKPAVGLVMHIIQQKHIPNVLFVPIGIEIEGIHGDYEHARNLTFARHLYIFNIGQAFTSDEIIKITEKQGISSDEFFYIQHRSLVSPEYLSK